MKTRHEIANPPTAVESQHTDRPKRFLCKRVSLFECVTDEVSDSDLESREEAKGWEPVMKRFSALMFLIPFCIYGKKELGFGATPHNCKHIQFKNLLP